MNRNQTGYYPSLDGVRGWMAFGVLVAHIHLPWFPGAMILMELFFVISGFLITSIIWRNATKYGKVHLLDFWKRRLLRLYPVLILVVVVCTSLACLLVEDPLPSLKDALATLFYVSNFTKLYDYIFPTIFGQTWSLGIEEQFYLLWPLLFWCLLKLRFKAYGVAAALILIALACTLWKIHLINNGAPWSRLYYAPDTRMDAFVVGGLLAIYYPYLKEWCQRPCPHAALILGSCAYLVLLVIGTPREMAYFYWQQSTAVVLAAMLVLLLVSPRDSFFKWLFSTKPSVFFGQRCYSIYLWHWPIIWLLLVTFNPDRLVLLAIVLPLVLVLSCLSYSYVEIPFLAKRNPLPALKPREPKEVSPTPPPVSETSIRSALAE
ncbi:acyltransferase family protein [Halopseudomonas bauzanensis]|uniref:acyltransferase family protein n=1 Tax=Halopseudomonas bauzanensis TaxID=653930 RepID=UPI002555E2E4|nr:acyltransferase [Halopseudomonas bauzanensis]